MNIFSKKKTKKKLFVIRLEHWVYLQGYLAPLWLRPPW